MARPNRLNYATGPEGQKRFVEALRKYQAKQKAAKEKAAAKKPAPKKPVAKKPVAKKPATKKPAAKKPVAKKPPVKKPVTKKPVAKKPVAKKPAAKKPVAKKPATTTTPKRGPGRPKGSTNKTQKRAPKTNQNLKILKDGAKKLKDTGKQIYDAGKKQLSKAQTKLAAKDQTPQQPIPEGKSKGAKFAKKVNQKIANYAKRVYNKAALDTFKFKTVMKDPSKRNINRAGVKRGIGAGAALQIGNALINRLTKPKGMSHKEWADFKTKQEQKGQEKTRKIIKKGYDFYGKRLKKVSSDLTGKKYESSTTKNINKQKKANKSNNTGLKIRKTERSSRKNTNKDYNAPTATKTADKRFSTFRVDPQENRKLQLERQKGNTETYSRKLSPQAKKTKTTPTKSKPKKMHAIEKRNRERFGDAHVDRLKAKHAEWKKRRKKK